MFSLRLNGVVRGYILRSLGRPAGASRPCRAATPGTRYKLPGGEYLPHRPIELFDCCPLEGKFSLKPAVDGSEHPGSHPVFDSFF